MLFLDSGVQRIARKRRFWFSVFLYITDSYKVYPSCIEDADYLVSKTAITQVVRAASPLGRRRKLLIAVLQEPVCIGRTYAI